MSSAAATSSWESLAPAVGVAPGTVTGNDGIHMPLSTPGRVAQPDAGPTTPTSENSGDQADGDGGGELANDAEGVWSPDIEQSFQEALAIYPPCGRRKIILSDEGKMYGRNELIARYIKLRTGKVRTRKQVSSHIQVLARKKSRELQSRLKETTNNKEQEALQTYLRESLPNMSSAQIVSSAFVNKQNDGPAVPAEGQPAQAPYATVANATAGTNNVPASNAVPATVAASSSDHHSGQVATVGRSSPAAAAMLIKQEPPLACTASTMPTAIWPPTATAATAMAGAVYTPDMMFPRSLGAAGMASPPPGYVVASPLHNTALQRIHMPSPPLAGAPLNVAPMLTTFRLVDFNSYVEYGSPETAEPHGQHMFVHIGPNTNFSDPRMETIGISQIADKFPSLKELFEKGPQSAFYLVKFWADINIPVELDNLQASYGVSATYESSSDVACSCSTKVCSFGQQVVEKLETQPSLLEGGRYVVRFHRSPMCDYMINFIHKLRSLPERSMMNSVLENFTILQLVVNRETSNLLLCLAFVFEVSNEQGSYHRIYRLAKD